MRRRFLILNYQEPVWASTRRKLGMTCWWPKIDDCVWKCAKFCRSNVGSYKVRVKVQENPYRWIVFGEIALPISCACYYLASRCPSLTIGDYYCRYMKEKVYVQYNSQRVEKATFSCGISMFCGFNFKQFCFSFWNVLHALKQDVHDDAWILARNRKSTSDITWMKTWIGPFWMNV